VPIDIAHFEDAETLGPPPTSERILQFLRRNGGRAFTRSEIAAGIDADPETVGTNLTRLKERGTVRHRSPYWALAPEATSADSADGEATTDQSELEERVQSMAGPGVGTEPTVARPMRSSRRSRAKSARVSRRSICSAPWPGEPRPSGATLTCWRSSQTTPNSVPSTTDCSPSHTTYRREHGVVVEVHTLRTEAFRVRRDRGEPFVRTVVEEGVRRV